MADSSPAQEEQSATVRPYAAVLQEIDGGKVHATASAQLASLVEAITSTGKSGSLTLTLKIKPASRNSDVLIVTGAVGIKAPAPEAAESTFFVHNGALSRDNPKQPELPMRIVPGNADLPIREREAR